MIGPTLLTKCLPYTIKLHKFMSNANQTVENQNSKGKLRVAFVQGLMAPYLHPFFEKLAEKVDLTVYYCATADPVRKWETFPRNYKYTYKIMPGKQIGFSQVNPSVISELIKKRYDAIVLGGYMDFTLYMAFLTSRLLKPTKVLVWAEKGKEPKSILGSITKPVRSFLLRASDAVVVPGELSEKVLVNDMNVEKSKIFLAPDCLDNKLFMDLSLKNIGEKNSLKKSLGLNHKVLILAVAQLIERKGLRYLIDAYEPLRKKYADLGLVILGSGPQRDELKRYCSDKKILGVHFVESGLSCADLVKYYSVSDVFVLPTLDDVWGFVINEAMACGLPVISTKNCQAALEMIFLGENGYVVDEASAEKLYVALEKIIANSALRKSMGENSRKILMQRFDIPHMVAGFEKALHAVSDTKKPSGN
jgi:glycosyltransferase involved in cell wall biosynthesis